MNLKKLVSNGYKYFSNPDYRFIINAGLGRFDKMPDEEYLRKMFKATMGKALDLDNPKTINEKLQWLKLYNRNPEYTIMVDKYKARDYVAEKIGEEYLVPLLGVWDDPDQIDFNALPDQFVLKCNHNSGLGMCICKDKSQLDIKKVKKELRRGLNQNYYLSGREWPYKDVPRRIIAEKFMVDNGTDELRDYKFFCFNGVCKCMKVDFDRFIDHHANYYDPQGNILNLGESMYPPVPGNNIVLPADMDQIIKIAEYLSSNIPLLRTDFYDVNGDIYFGELTFYPASGFGKFVDNRSDYKLGEWIELPKSIGGGYITLNDKFILLLHPKKGKDVLNDYKIYTFNGNAKLCMINQDRGENTKADYYDRDFNWLDFTWGYDHAIEKPLKPVNYEQMFDLAEVLAKDTTHLRVDFYEINGNIYFGELTFFDGSGFDRIEPVEVDYKLGSWITLPKL